MIIYRKYNMTKFKKIMWFTLGIMCLGIAYVGVVTPGIPWSTPAVVAAFCFAKSSEKWHNYMMNHKLFGPFLRDWSEHRVFPRRGKIMMFISMDISLIMLWVTTQNLWLVLGVAVVMAATCAWAFRLPESREQAIARLNP
jgi:uncharacterized protein